MFKNLKRKFAKVALVVLALQLAFVGVGAGPKVASAAAGDYALTAVGTVGNFTTPEKSVVDSLGNVLLTDGSVNITDPLYFSSKSFKSVDVTLTQPAISPTFTGLASILPVAEPNVQLWAYSPLDGLWFDVNQSGFGYPAGASIGAYVGNTINVFVVSDREATYPLQFNLVESANISSVLASADANVVVESPYTLSAVNNLGNMGLLEPSFLDGTTGNTVMGGIVTPITAPNYLDAKSYKKINITLTRDLTAPNYSGNVRFLPTSVPGIQVWAFVPNLNPLLSRWYDVNQSGFGAPAGSDVSVFLSQPLSVYVVSATEGTYPVSFKLADVADKTVVLATKTVSVIIDATAPVVTMTSKPIIVNNVQNAIEVTFTGNEPIVLDSLNVTFVQGAKSYLGTPLTQVNLTKLVVIVPADTFDSGVAPIDVAGTFADLSGNLTTFTGQIKVDTIAPAGITGLTTFVDASGHVVLSWVNPPAGTYTTLRIVRVGDFTSYLDTNATSYTDLTTIRSQTYQYFVIVRDEAGNETSVGPVSVEVLAPVVAATVSDNTNFSADNIDTNTNTEEVKAQTAEEDESEDTSKEDNGFPIWGIILLVILALVGGYLIWNQKPAPVAETKKNNKK